jgi:hypothetical protein
MEISPVIGIVSLPVIKAPPADIGLPAVYDIENTARISDETYTPSGGKSAGGNDDFDEQADEEEPESEAKPNEDGPNTQISIFA